MNASGATIVGMRGAEAISGDQGTDTPDQAQAAGVDSRLPRGRADQRVVARRGYGDEIGQHELQALVVPPVQLGVSEQLLGGLPDGQVRLEGAFEQRVLMPRGSENRQSRSAGVMAELPLAMPASSAASLPTRRVTVPGRRARWAA